MMTDRQLRELIDAVKPAPPSFWTATIQGVLVTVLAALIISFCALVWSGSMAASQEVAAVKLEQRRLQARQDAIVDVFAHNIASWRVGHTSNVLDYTTAFQKAESQIQYDVNAAVAVKMGEVPAGK